MSNTNLDLIQMKKQGSLVRRHEGNKKSALGILGELVNRRRKITLQIQHEMVENKKDLNETAAGQQLDQDILREKAKHKAEMRELKHKMDQAIKKHDDVAKAYIADMQQGLQAKIEEGEKARESIRADFEKLQKDREEEMEKMKNRINEQVKQLEESSKKHDDLQAKIEGGQGNPKMERQLHDYEQKMHSLEMKVETQTKLLERRKGGKSVLKLSTLGVC
jgi:chromosome segregation ATPase